MIGSFAPMDFYIRGATCGALLIFGFSIACSRGVSVRARLALPLTSASAICWLITVSPPTWSLFNDFTPLLWASFPLAGLFWLMIRIVFDDSPPRRLDWVPAGYLLVIRMMTYGNHGSLEKAIWLVGNITVLFMGFHAAYLVIRGYWGDLLERRRRLRLVGLGGTTLFGLWEGGLGMIGGPARTPSMLFVDQPYGVAMFGVLLLATSALFLEARADLQEPQARRIDVGGETALLAEVRARAADQALLDKLSIVMKAGAWRREGLTIGGLAGDLGVPEHRLRRVINKQLGHRNFADFLNAHRILAAKQRLSDPASAHLTVAAIAFDLGYGSIGPFNRAFRVATGTTPTAWRNSTLRT